MRSTLGPPTGAPRIRGTRILRDTQRVLAVKNIGLLLFLIILWAIISQLTPYFLRTSNILILLNQIATVAIASVGMTYVIISGGVDLSVGGVAALSGMVVGICVMNLHMGFLPAVLLGMMVGLLAGLVNGVLISHFHLQPMICTLGTMSIARGITLISTSGHPIFVVDSVINQVGNGTLLGIPVPVLIAFVVFVIGHIVLGYTEFGRYVYAIGGNQEATRLSGINVERNKILIYVISGFTASLVGIVLVGILGASEPTVGQGLELDSIAVVAIGGTSLMGGVGGLVGTLLGSILIGTIKNSLTIMNIVSYYQQVIIGVVIIVAVLLEYLRNRRRR